MKIGKQDALKLTGKGRRCAYCGSGNAVTRDHVISRSLYPIVKPSKATPQIQRITVPACKACNRSWAADEAHFRDMLLLCSEPTPIMREIWEGRTRRSFQQPDGHKRLRDLFAQMMPVQGGHMVYPAKDERVMKLVRKVVRGLCYHHQLQWPVGDDEVWADVQRFDVSAELLDAMRLHHVDKQVIEYRYGILDDPDYHSCWALRFFNRPTFFALVRRTTEARHLIATAFAT